MRILLENKMKKSNVLWLFIGVVLSLPILLNIFLMVEWLPVIQAGTTPALWLTFWGSYIGSVISALIAFYVLYVNRKDHFSAMSYELERKSIEDNLSYAVNYISIYSTNDIKQVYNIWKLTNDNVSCRERIKVLLDNAFYHYESFMIRFPTNRLSSELFFLRQQENYLKFVILLQDLQVLFSLDNTYWKSAKSIKEKIDEINTKRGKIDGNRKSRINYRSYTICNRKNSIYRRVAVSTRITKRGYKKYNRLQLPVL